MKKTLCLLLVLVTGINYAADTGWRINFDVGNVYISHPYYLNASSTQNDLSQNIILKFSVAEKNKSWAYLAVKVTENQLDDNFSGVKIVYKASLPPGIKMSLVVEESEAAYDYSWVPAKNGEWETIVIPFERMTISSWNRKPDSNQKLDISQIRTILLGASGQASQETKNSPGLIEVKDVIILRK